MNPELPRDWSAARSEGAIEEFSVDAVRRYALHTEIGAGSVATVHLARLHGPDGFVRTVAVKRIRSQYAKDTELVAMLLDGARLAARVRHPNVVPALDVVTAPEFFVVLEYVHGESLATLLRTLRGRGAQAPLPVVSGVFAGVLRGLHAVHAARGDDDGDGDGDGEEVGDDDASPHDVLVGADGVARLIDIGARWPRGRVQPPRADRFAVAAVLWEALAGRQLLPRIGPEGFEPPSRYRPEIPAELDAVVARGLAHDPAARFATANEMALAVEAAVAPASPAQIGEWVESLARPALDERAQFVARVEGAALPEKPPVRSAAVDAAGVVTRRERASTTPPPPPSAATRAEPRAEAGTGTQRGLGPAGATGAVTTDRRAAVRASSPDWTLPRQPHKGFLAALAVIVVIAIAGVHHLTSAPAPVAAPATVEPVAQPAPTVEPEQLRAEAAPPPRDEAPHREVIAPHKPPPPAAPPVSSPVAARPAKPRQVAKPTRDDVL